MRRFRRQSFIIGMVCASVLTTSAVLAETPVDTLETAQQPVKSPRQDETWNVFFIGGSRVGYGHTAWREKDDEGRQLIHWTSTNHMTLKRFGQTITQTLKLTSVESAEGELIRFRSELIQGKVPGITDGTVRGDRLLLEITTAGKRHSAELPWDPSWLGFAASEQYLVRQPMQPGQTRKHKTLMPVFNHIAEVQLDAVDYEPTELLTGTHELLRVNSAVNILGKVDIQSVVWVDRTGQTLKSYDPILGQYGYRATKELALERLEEVEFDLGQFSTVRLDRSLTDPHRTKQIVYRVRLEEGDPSGIFVTGLSQTVTAIDAQTSRITVRAIRPGAPLVAEADATRQPSKDDLEANNLIQSDDKRIVRMASRIAADANKPWDIARELERYVGDQIQFKDFSQAFATAAEVAKTLEGDCTEHAVLLAALCRARNIPSRVAMGLVYYAQERGFAYHMWNEVWIHDRWVPLDATIGMGGIGAAHLKLGDSNLKGAFAYTAFLPVIQVLGRLSINIETVE